MEITKHFNFRRYQRNQAQFEEMTTRSKDEKRTTISPPTSSEFLDVSFHKRVMLGDKRNHTQVHFNKPYIRVLLDVKISGPITCVRWLVRCVI